jgi:hypothetical protein
MNSATKVEMTRTTKMKTIEQEVMDAESVSETDSDGESKRVSPMPGVCTVRVFDDPVPVQPPNVLYHESWETWNAYLETYMDETQQVICVAEVVSVQNRNKRIRNTKIAKSGAAVTLVPLEWKRYQKTYICTHGWSSKSRGTGQRVKRHIRSTDCPFRFIVQVVEVSSGNWKLLVKLGCFKHNHSLGDKEYATYPTSRGIQDTSVASNVEIMVQSGAKRSTIMDYLLAKGENVIARDVDNLVDGERRREANYDDDEATSRLLVAFKHDDDGNIASVDETDAGQTGVISFSTRRMRETVARFPEMLLVDCTHKTNRYVNVNM